MDVTHVIVGLFLMLFGMGLGMAVGTVINVLTRDDQFDFDWDTPDHADDLD